MIIFSIVILVYNEEKYLSKLFNDLLKIIRRINYKTEILFIDSESTDQSVKIIKNFIKKNLDLKIKLIKIKKTDFHFARTRNYSVKLCRGKYIVFLSADALIKNYKFFDYFLEDFSLDKKIVAVFGGFIPRRETPLLQKIEATVRFDFLNQFLKNKILIFDKKKPFIPYSKENLYYWWYLSNAFSCFKRSFLVKYPFPNINGYEDYAIGKIILEKGYKKVYDSRCKVIHSHTYNLIDYFKSQVEEISAINNNLKIKKPINLIYKIKKILNYQDSFKNKLTALLMLPFFYFIKILAYILVKILDKKL